jgi:DNA mismatch repair ATPase MutS
MTSSGELASFYQKRKINFEDTLSKVNEKITSVSNLRIIVAIALMAIIYFGFSTNIFLFLLAIPFIAIFVFLVLRHSSLYDEKIHLENLVRINHQEHQGLEGNISSFAAGLEFIDPHHPYSHDLDIFGEGSLFQAINRCNSFQGKKYMAQRLSAPLGTPGEIIQQQQAIKELSGKTDFRHHFQASGMEMQEQPEDYRQLLAWLQQPFFIFTSSWYKIILIILPVATVLAVGAAFFIPAFRSIAIFLALSQWAILGWNIKKVNTFHEQISRKKDILEKYARLLHYFQKENFLSPVMQGLRSRANEADVKVKLLASLVSSLNARLNSLTNVFVNSLFMYDLQYVYRLEKWKHENSDNLKIWLDAVRDTEVLCSLGTFAFNHPLFTFPEINSTFEIRALSLGHPLIQIEECVVNDLKIGNGQSVLIITGANMAGKSTFLRTIGVNLVLALTGAPVFAKDFTCPIINIRSGMRTADSLKDHQSYFYAELNRLKTIMDELRSDKPLFILLDEILKGTNSTDKQSGSIALVKQLIPHPCLAMIATHDLALGDLEKQFPNDVKNFCFEANIENDQLSFDYKLKPGLAQKMNATFLMRKMGIIESV